MNSKFVETITLTKETYDTIIKNNNDLLEVIENRNNQNTELDILNNNLLNTISNLKDNIINYILNNNIYIENIINCKNYDIKLEDLLDEKKYYLEEEYVFLINKCGVDIDRIKMAITDIWNEHRK